MAPPRISQVDWILNRNNRMAATRAIKMAGTSMNVFRLKLNGYAGYESRARRHSHHPANPRATLIGACAV